MKKIFTLLLTVLAFASAKSQSSTVVISQVYGGGGSTTGTFKSDYVELHNISTVSQDVSGYKIIYGASASNLGTGTNIFTFPSATIIPAGGYVLVANAASTGLANLNPAADYTATFAIAATAGKVAFGNALLVGGTTYAVQLATGNVIDFVGFGGANEFETAPTATLSATSAAIRKINGCTETNNNSTDFSVSAPAPRNSASPANACTSPTLIASPNITGLVTPLGVASASQSYNVSASNLTPAAGNIAITPTTGLEISFNNSTFFSTAQTLGYTGGAITSTPIYVRIAASAAQGALTGAMVTNAGGGATSAVVTVAGGVTKNYYSNAVGNLNVAATWGDNTMGTMNPPADFTIPYSIFNVVNRATTMLGGPLDVSGTGSKIIIGDGTTATTLTTTLTDSIKATNTVEALNLGKLILGNKVAPIFGNLASGSTVDYAFAGTNPVTDTVKVNVATYHNLKLTGGLKFLKSGTTTVNGNLVISATASMNGASSPFSTLILKGNLDMLNSAAMEDTTATNGFPNRLTLTLAGTATQNINTNGSELAVFRIQKDTVNALSDLDINVAANSKILIGNNSGGDLKLTQKISGTPTFTTMTMGANAQIAFARNGSVFTDANGKAGKINATDAKIIMNKSITSTTINPGTLLFVPGSSLNELTVNITTPTKDSLLIANTIDINNVLNLTKGVIVMAAGQDFRILSSAIVNGGSVNSYVDGSVRGFIDPMVQPSKLFPVGKNKQYSPIEITVPTGDNYTVQYFKQSYSNTTVNSATLTAIPTYNVSTKEYWDIERGDASIPNIKFYYNNPNSAVLQPTLVRIAHFNGTDWDDLGRDGNGTDANGTYVTINSVTSFSPFTFGGPTGVLPIILESFNGSINNSVSALAWKTSCESAGDVFVLQYSVDGITFNNIYNTDAIGNCNGNIYKYNHLNATAVVNYYRLLMVNADGRKNYSNVVLLKNGKNNFETKIVSTNNKAQLGFSISSPAAGKGLLQIVNLQGQKIYNQTIAYNNGYQLNYVNTATWSNGLYLVSFTNENGIISTIKYVK